MGQKIPQKKPTDDFMPWLMFQAGRNDLVGDLAAEAQSVREPPKTIEELITQMGARDHARGALRDALRERGLDPRDFMAGDYDEDGEWENGDWEDGEPRPDDGSTSP